MVYVLMPCCCVSPGVVTKLRTREVFWPQLLSMCSVHVGPVPVANRVFGELL